MLYREDVCPVCGGSIIGDGYTMTFHCENVDLPSDIEPDADVVYCSTEGLNQEYADTLPLLNEEIVRYPNYSKAVVVPQDVRTTQYPNITVSINGTVRNAVTDEVIPHHVLYTGQEYVKLQGWHGIQTVFVKQLVMEAFGDANG